MATPSVILVAEDALCGALGQKLIDSCLGWPLLSPAITSGGITKFMADVPRFRAVARRYPVVGIADVDGKCPVEMRHQLCPAGTPAEFLLRLAVREAESWVLADGTGLASFLEIAPAHMIRDPDSEVDAKRALLGLVRRSRVRPLKQEMVSADDPNKPGSGYNVHLLRFVRDHWTPHEAALHSPSLARAVSRIQALK